MSENQRADQGSGSATDASPANPIVRAVERAVKELETARGYMERDISGLDRKLDTLIDRLADFKTDVEGRLSKLETNVSHLPSKTWIFTVAGGFVAAVGILITAVYKIASGH